MKFSFNKILNKKFSNYFLNYHKLNTLNKSIQSIENLNFFDIPEYNLARTRDYTHLQTFKHKSNFCQEFVHEVLSLIINPSNLNSNNKDLCKEAIELAKYYIHDLNIKIGAYSDSMGIVKLRENLINRLYEDQNIDPIDINSVMFTNGSNCSIEHILTTICDRNDQILIPNPFYPFIKNIANSKDLVNLEYRLTKENWNIDIEELNTIYNSNKKFYPIKAMIFANPSEPTGKVYDKKTTEEIIKFCYKNKLVLISCEIAKDSIICNEAQKKYVSTAEVLKSMPDEIRYGTTVYTILGLTRRMPNMSSIRSGACYVHNINKDVSTQLIKYKSIDICSSVISQIAFDIINVQNLKKRFGEEFSNKYFEGIINAKKEISTTKDKLVKLLNSNPKNHYFVNDIESGINLFSRVNSLKVNQIIEKYYKSEKSYHNLLSPGTLYGSNRENYLNIVINNSVDYSFLDI